MVILYSNLTVHNNKHQSEGNDLRKASKTVIITNTMNMYTLILSLVSLFKESNILYSDLYKNSPLSL